MKFESYLKKAKILLEEARKDLINGCYNKAVSASWFAVENLLRALLLRGGKIPPERPNKLISIIHKMLYEKYPDKRYLIPEISSLYEKRKRADHRDTFFDHSQADRAFSQAIEIFKGIEEILFSRDH